MHNKKNAVSAIIYQTMTMLQGLILPRLILVAFGSDINGFTNSITQFLGFISLLEGGLGAVVLAELYLPIENNDESRIKKILLACQTFFNKLALAFIIYALILAVVYPCFIVHQYSFAFTSTLVLILSLVTFAQYAFSLTYKLYLQANQQLYIVNIIASITIAINTISAIIIITVFPRIHAVKLCSGIIYLLQPLAFKHFVEKKYQLPAGFHLGGETSVLKNRWSGFSQNLAHFINMNTDVAILTLFTSLSSVSIYTVYMLAISALKGIITSVGNSYQSALGKYIAEGDKAVLDRNFKRFEALFWFFGVTLFSTCLLLINSFVAIYTDGVTDANYYQPLFAAIIVIANMVYVIREPYRLLILAAGKFKETNFGAIMEVILNIVISILLVWELGLVGVAIGTLIAIIFRTIYFMWFLKRDIVYRGYSSYLINIACSTIIAAGNLYIYCTHSVESTTIVSFCIHGILCVCANGLLYAGLYSGLNYVVRLFKK